MASATPLKDIDEQFLQCCICMEQLKEPKILPCLHRYCQVCLKGLTKEGAKKIQCVTCRAQHTLPKDGINGLKTDFNTKNIIEFIQLQDSVKGDPLRDCIHCKKKLKASAFCFKCNDFLCKTCHEFHASSSMFKDHHPHIFSLSEAEAANLTVQKLSSLKEAPRCQAHPGKLSELCCTTCNNLPICMPCTYGEHKGHDLTEVASLAKIQREMLRGKVADSMQYKEKAYQMQKEMRKNKEKLDLNVEKHKAQIRRDTEVESMKEEIRKVEEELKIKQTEIEGKMEAKRSQRKECLEKEMKKLGEEYELACEEERRYAEASLKKLRVESKRKTDRLEAGLRFMNDGIKKMLTLLKTQKDKQARKIKELSNHFDGLVKRFETVTTTVDCIGAAENAWADVQCIPDVCRAIDLLSEDVKEGSQRLGNPSAVKARGLSPAVTVNCKDRMSRYVESVIDMKNVMPQWETSDITGNEDDSIAIIGQASQYQAHLIIINLRGDVLQQKVISASDPFWSPKCSFLTQYQIALICDGDKLGIYDMRDQSLKLAMMKYIIRDWPSDQRVCSVTTDRTKGHITVGCKGRNVHVFNNELKHIRSITLPAGIERAYDIAVHESDLLVCDTYNDKAFAVTVHGTVSQVKYEFTKPPIEGSVMWPERVCTDQNGYVYMLWGVFGCGALIVQYSKDGGQIVMMKEVELDGIQDVRSMTSVRTRQGEKLLLKEWKPSQIDVYGLV